jgi:hypothetical protein
MKLRYKCLVILPLLLLASGALFAQMRVMPGGRKIVLGKDTLCFQYRFAAGDTLLYSIESRDSVIIEQRGALAKTRSEKLRIVCDSTASGRYYLRLATLRASEYQANEMDTVFRPGHPWVGREVFIVIDSLGHRFEQRHASPLAGMCPGGAFQPLRLPVIDTSCGRQNDSWLSQDTLLAIENGLPAPIIGQTVLWRVGDMLDTIGRKAQWIMYSLTGFGVVDMSSSEIAMANTASIAEAGRIVFDKQLMVPLVATIQQDNRFTVESFAGSRQKTTGKHLMMVTMELDRLASKDPSRQWSRNSAAPARAGRRQRK